MDHLFLLSQPSQGIFRFLKDLRNHRPAFSLNLQNAAIDFPVIHNKNAPVFQQGRRSKEIHPSARMGGLGEEGEKERRPGPRRAFDPDLSAHRFNKTFGNYQTQTGSAMVARYGRINLTERLE